MDFLAEFVIISLAGGFVAFDTTAGWQIMISQPLVACTLVGLIFGNPQLGLLMGILMQLPWLKEMPVGGAHHSDSNIGAFVAASLTVILARHEVNTDNILIVITIIYGLAVGWFSGNIVASMRKANNRIVYQADKAAEAGDTGQITRLNVLGMIYAYITGLVIVAISFIAGYLMLSKLGAFIPVYFDKAFGYARIGILALGVGSMISMFLTRKRIHFFAYGAVIALALYLIF